MSNVSRTRARSRAPQKHPSLKVFGAPPLVPGESPAEYEQLLEYVSNAVQPHDFIECIGVRDVVDLEWEILRLRRYGAGLLNANAHKGLRAILSGLMSARSKRELPPLYGDFGVTLAQEWAAGYPEAVDTVNSLLRRAGMHLDAVMAQTMALEIEKIAVIESMTRAKIVARDRVLCEMERRRAISGRQLREAVQVIEAADGLPIAPSDGDEGKNAA